MNTKFLLAFLLLLIAVPPLKAVDNTFTGSGNQNWNSTLWSLGHEPTASEDVIIGSTSGAQRARIGQTGTISAVANSVVFSGSGGDKAIRFTNNASSLTVGGGTGSITKGTLTGGLAVIDVLQTGTIINVGTVNVDRLNVGVSGGSGSLSISSGQAYTLNTDTIVGGANGITGNLTLAGGSLSTVMLSVTITNGAIGNFNLDSGTLSATTIQRVGGGTTNFIWNDGTIQNISGSDLTITGTGANTLQVQLAGTGTHSLNVGSGRTVTLTGNATFVDKSGDQGTLTKDGAGTLNLANASTYTGSTDINAGTVLVSNSSGSGLGTGNVTVDGGRLGGTGIIALTGGNSVSVAGGASLMGGDGVSASGTLTINGDVSLADNSIIRLTLSSGGTHSTIARTGGTWVFDSNQAFSLIDGGGALGAYSNIITGLASDPGVGSWTIANPGWSGTFSYDSGNVSLNLTSVPEPSAWLLAGAGAFLVFARCRRRKTF